MHPTPVDSLFPAEPGTYVLVLHAPAPAQVVVGRLGLCDLPAGWHLYVGSAQGPGGLRGRLRHHLRPVQKPHWHVDWLRTVASVQEIWFATGNACRECAWAAALAAQAGAARHMRGFGASDCRCAGHLISGLTPSAATLVKGAVRRICIEDACRMEL